MMSFLTKALYRENMDSFVLVKRNLASDFSEKTRKCVTAILNLKKTIILI